MKEILLEQAGDSFPSHVHKWDHLSHVAEGVVDVEVGGVTTRLTAPSTVLVKAGRDHKITAVSDRARWLCIHAIREADGTILDYGAIEYNQLATLPTPLTVNP
ncbi:MAG: cupin domain-containing protein [Burkholderiales bacterium]